MHLKGKHAQAVVAGWRVQTAGTALVVEELWQPATVLGGMEGPVPVQHCAAAVEKMKVKRTRALSIGSKGFFVLFFLGHVSAI